MLQFVVSNRWECMFSKNNKLFKACCYSNKFKTSAILKVCADFPNIEPGRDLRPKMCAEFRSNQSTLTVNLYHGHIHKRNIISLFLSKRKSLDHQITT